MEWLVLALLIPATIVPIVLLFGFSGCVGPVAVPCGSDVDCPAGTRCVLGSCRPVGEPGGVPESPPAAPEGLVANGFSDSEIELSWTTDDLTVTSFEVQRAEEGEDFAPIADPTAPTFRDTGLAEGRTYLYQVRAFDGQEFSEPSDQTSATTFPRAPSNLTATPIEVDRIDLGWTNQSARATRFSLEHRLPPGGAFTEIFNDTEATFSHTGLAGGSDHEYRVIAIVPAGFQNEVPQAVRSAPSTPVSARTWAEAFSLALADPQDLSNFCLLQRISAAEFANFPTLLGTIGTTVRVTVRSSTSGTLTLNRVYLSQVAPLGDPWDSAPDLTRVVDVDQGDPVLVLPPDTSRVLGPIAYALDRTRDLLVAFDFGDTPGQLGVVSIPRPGAIHYFKATTQEASVPDRAPDFSTGQDRHYLVERIEVL
jgi:hypothetical protein